MRNKINTNQKDRRVYSLRQRYLFVSTIIVVLIFAAAWLAQSYVSKNSALHQQGIEHRHQVRQYTRHLQFEVIQIEKALENFMWTPTPKLRNDIHHNIDRALHTYERLSRYEWSAQKNIESILGDFAYDLKALHATLDRVMDLRLKHESESPMLQEVEQRVSKASTQLKQLNEELGNNSYSLSLQLETSITLWANLYRQYTLLISKTSENITEEQLLQKNQIEQLYRQLFYSLEGIGGHPQISTNSKRKKLISEITEALSMWQLGYEVIKLERDNSIWRGDIRFLEQTPDPQFDHLREYLQELDIAIDNYFKHDAIILGEVANTIVGVVWLLSFLGLLVITIAYLYFRGTVLRPIATVAAALKREATEESAEAIPVVHNLETRHLISAFDEMRRQVQDRQQALEHIATHDSLTGLPNRYHLMQTLQATSKSTQAFAQHFALIVFGLDRFKEFNETLGQHTGDTILRNFGNRLRYLLQDEDMVARIGGDEFVVLLHNTERDDAYYRAQKLRREMEQHPFDIKEMSLSVSSSMGVAMYPDDSRDGAELMRLAHIAMAIAKQHRTGITLYEKRFDNSSIDRISLASDLRQAIEQHELHLCYQPQYSGYDEKLSGMEVLCRWEHPQRGFISPEEFIPVAEHTDLIHSLTSWVVSTALEQASQWRDQGLDCGSLAINISAFNLHAPNFYNMLEKELARTHFPASSLILEITETAMMADPEQVIKTLGKLKRLGLKLSIDDYGTGFSSLAYIKQLPVNELKIDKSFVMDMVENEDDAIIVHSTIELAHNLGLKVVAEGVDNTESLELLRILNCDYLQGYHLNKPLLAEQIKPLLGPVKGKRSKVHDIKDYR